MLGERLFQKFDTIKKSCINFEEFLTGLAAFSKGTIEEKYKIIFDLYDLKQDGVIDKNELVTIVSFIQIHNSYKETADWLPQPTLTSENSLTPDLCIQLNSPSQPRRSLQKRRTISAIDNDAYVDKNPSESLGAQFQERRVQLIAAHILDTFGDKNILTFTDFCNFINQHPQIFEIFRSSYKEKI